MASKRKAVGQQSLLTHAELLEKVARMYYINQLSQKEIQHDPDLPISSASTVTRLLQEARELGVISFSVDASFAIIGFIDQSLTRNLREAFDLADASVIKADLTESDNKRVDDDTLHKILANHAGVKIRNQIQPYDHIAVAGGRAVIQAVKAISRLPPSRRNIQITPLCGRTWSHFWNVDGPGIIDRPLDADDSAFILAMAFEHEKGVRYSQVAQPLFAESPQEARRIIEEYCEFLPNGTWRDGNTPTRALVGIGVVNPDSGHRFVDLFHEKKKSQEHLRSDPYLSNVSQELKEAVNIVRDVLPHFGDITNLLFPTLPLPEEIKDPKDLSRFDQGYDKLGTVLAKLNDRRIGVNWNHLQSIATVTAITGGQYKTHVLWTMLLTTRLAPDSRIINDLVTDAKNARELLNAWRAFQKCPQEVQSWYEMMVKKLFLPKGIQTAHKRKGRVD